MRRSDPGLSVLERLERLSIPEPNSGCWLWLGTLVGGYGHIDITENGTRRSRKAHIVAYELQHGPVADGYELDHKCRTPMCINAAHLEQVTHQENVLRGTGPTAINAAKNYCTKGHELSGDNLRVATYRGKKYRQCLTCKRAREKTYRPPGTRRSHARRTRRSHARR